MSAAQSQDMESRLEAVEKSLAAFSKRLGEVERPENFELLGRRYKELRELIEFVTVVTHTDVLANIIGQLRVNKRELELRLAATQPKADTLAEQA